MNDLERRANHFIRCYLDAEPAPPGMDARILARLRAEAERQAARRQARRWAALVGVAAAVVLLLWVFLPGALLSRGDADESSAALRGQVTTGSDGSARNRAPAQGAERDPAPSLPLEPVVGDDPGVMAIRQARSSMQAGEFLAAFSRLEPCRQSVGEDALLEECEALVIESLCRAGRVVEGRQRMVAFRGRWRRSTHLRKLIATCTHDHGSSSDRH